jgi:putative peptidoglycan lipid II flippase
MSEPSEPPHSHEPQLARGIEPQLAPGAGGGAARVALGILASRLMGFLRERGLAYFFGVGPHADVFRTALRAPNALQNLLGEGTLSAAFIPVYSRLLAAGRQEEAGRFAGAMLGLLIAVAGGAALVGVLFARLIVAVLAPGFLDDGAAVAAGGLGVDRYELTVRAVRILFPMTAVLVLSAWSLGVLNSHRRFLLPYVAPVVWNAAILAALMAAGAALVPGGLGAAGEGVPVAVLDRILIAACIGGLAGGLLQFLVQLPLVLRLLRGFRLSLSTRVEGVREALATFGPVVGSRGVVQLAGYLDIFLGSFLAAGAPAAIGYAQLPYQLPVSLFGLSVAAAELPELARLRDPAAAEALLGRVRRSLARMAFFNVPTAVGYLAFGFLIVGALYRTGSFGPADTWLVYLVLCGYTLGLLATTSARLLQNTFYALGDARTPARIAMTRVAVSTSLAVPLMLWLDRFPVTALVGARAAGRPVFLGAVGLGLTSALGGWFELWRLRRALARRLPGEILPLGVLGRMLGLAAAAALPAAALAWLLPPLHPALRALLVVGTYAAAYLLLAHLAGVGETRALAQRFLRRARRQ